MKFLEMNNVRTVEDAIFEIWNLCAELFGGCLVERVRQWSLRRRPETQDAGFHVSRSLDFLNASG
jgi:hypothetical protein